MSRENAADLLGDVSAQTQQAAPPDVDGGKYTYRYSIPIITHGAWALSGRLEASILGERGESDPHSTGKTNKDIGAQQTLRERRRKQVDEAGDKLSTRLRVAAAEAYDVTNLTEVSLVGIPVTLKLEVKGLEAELDLANGDVGLDLLKLSFIGRADIGAIGPEILPEGFPLDVELVAEIRLDVTLTPEVIADVLRMRNAAKHIEDASEVINKLDRTDLEIAKIERELADLEGKPRKYPAIYDAKPRLQRRLKELKANRSKLGKLVDKAKGVTKAATEAYEKARSKLGHGFAKVADKVIGKSLKKALSKFIPIYNAISTAQDIYDVAEFIFSDDRTKEGTQQEGIGDDKEGGDSDQKIEGPADEDEPGQGHGGEGDGYDDELLEPVLDPFASVPLHPAAQAVLDHTGGGPVQLTEEQMQLLNCSRPGLMMENWA